MSVQLSVQGQLAVIVGFVACVHSLGVASNGELTVNNRVLAGQIWLVEIVRVGDIRAAETRIHDNWSVGAHEHSHTTSSAGWASVTFLVQSNIACNNDS